MDFLCITQLGPEPNPESIIQLSPIIVSSENIWAPEEQFCPLGNVCAGVRPKHPLLLNCIYTREGRPFLIH